MISGAKVEQTAPLPRRRARAHPLIFLRQPVRRQLTPGNTSVGAPSFSDREVTDGRPLLPLRELDALRCHAAMNEERNKAVVARFDELGNGTGDIDTLDELCTPDIVNHALAASAAPGLEGTRNFLRKAQRGKYPARWVESHIVASGDYVVQFGVSEQE
jgi:hypothetical protein